MLSEATQFVTMEPVLLTSFIMLASTALIYFYAPYWSVRKVPGPPTIPLLGHLHLFAIYGTDIFAILAKRYGPVFRFHLGRQPLVVVADPEMFRELGIKKFKDMHNRSIIGPVSASPLLSQALALARDARWSTLRSTMTSMYQPTHLANELPAMKSVVDTLIAKLSNSKEEEVNFSNLSIKLSIDIIGQSAFGMDFGLSRQSLLNGSHDHSDNLASDFMYTLRELKMGLNGSLSLVVGIVFPILQKPLRQILKRLPWCIDWKQDQIDKKSAGRIEQIILKRLNDGTDERKSKDFLTLILQAKESQEASQTLFTPECISALSYEHLLAGSTTISFALDATVYLVSGHLDVEKKLLKEIDDFGPKGITPTAKDLIHTFPYLNQVLKEAMRFYYASPLVAREASREVEIGGYVLPKGTSVWLALGVIGSDPKQFPNPDTFNPDRFDAISDEEKQRHPYANVPFGIGPRACVGMNFALQELRLAVFLLYQNFIFQHSPNMEKPLALEYGIFQTFKHGVKLKVIPRT